ncbi:DUF1198 family protein [Serratia microhaemolytica]|uniref:DUF1198 family protein n=1 Tax=Serratia microhaemolytica TaxID=2675110 RepID=UPI000FDD6B51|nr:DUF1198 family protein [Serratia microhaemolytica]
MIWFIIAALVAVFLIGYRFITADARKAIDSLANFINVKPLLVESMLQEMGSRHSQLFIRNLNNGYTEQMHQAAYLLFIYHTFVKQADEQQLAQWSKILLNAGLPVQLSAEHSEAALFYFADLQLDPFELAQFRRALSQTD